jgi:hypothetical protein
MAGTWSNAEYQVVREPEGTIMLKKIVRPTAAVIASIVTMSVASSGRAATVPFPVSAGGTGNGYEVMFDTSADEAAAQSAAASAGGHLVSITSASEQTFIESLLASANAPTGSYWIGLERIGSGSSASAFAWETNEPLGFTHFAGGEPNNYPANENRGTIYWSQSPSDPGFSRRGAWNDAPVAGFPNGVLPEDLVRQGFILEIEGAGRGIGSGGGNGGGDGNAVPLPPAILAAPLGMLLAGLASRRRKV